MTGELHKEIITDADTHFKTPLERRKRVKFLKKAVENEEET